MNMVQLFRRIRYSKGFGVHSPFAFNLITQVIGEKECAYYSYDEIALLLQKLKYNPETVALKKPALSKKKGELLFRLANEFQFKSILQIGAAQSIPALYLTAYSKNSNCLIVEQNKKEAVLAKNVLKYASVNNIQLRENAYVEFLSNGHFPSLNEIDCFYFYLSDQVNIQEELLQTCLASAKEESVVMIDNIQTNKAMRRLWNQMVEQPTVTVSMDLYDIGLLFLNKKYYKRHYPLFY